MVKPKSPSGVPEDSPVSATALRPHAAPLDSPPSPAEGSSKTPPGPPKGPEKSRLGTFDSFKIREFRWFYLAMLGQMASMNMTFVVPGLLAFELTGSFAALGLVGLFGATPMLLLSMFGGVIADRMPKKTVLQVGQFFSLLNAGAMSGLIFVDLISMEWIYVSALVQGTIMALMMPSRQAMIPELVGRDRLMNAISLNMAGMNTMQLIAPAVGGFIVSVAGFDWAYLTIASLYGLAVAGLSRLTWRRASVAPEPGLTVARAGLNSLADIREGLVYIRQDRLIFALLSISFISSIFAMSHLTLMPGYVADIFDGDGSKLGLMFSISAVGSLAAMLGLASFQGQRRGLLLIASMVLIGAGILLFAQTSNFWLAAAIMVFIGVGSALRQALIQGLLQEYSDHDFRGRVIAVFMLQFSIMQIGTFIVGIIAEAIGIQPAFMGLGVGLMLVTVAVYALLPRIRQLS